MKSEENKFANSPVVWFSVLETERNRGNFELAAQAKEKLKQLGISVKYRGKAGKQLEQAKTLSEKTIFSAGLVLGAKGMELNDAG